MLVSQHQSLNVLIGRTEAATGGDIELIGHWGKYLCVLTAGFLENALQAVYSDFVERTSSPSVAKFSIAALGRISNPKASRFIETARSFDPDWADELEAYIDEDGSKRRNAINSIMAVRHQIAHGKSTSMSVGRIRQCLPSCVEVVEFIEEQTR
jgi:hypothetical protein